METMESGRGALGGAEGARQEDVGPSVAATSGAVGFTPGPWQLVTYHRQGPDRLVPVWYVKASNDVGVAVQPSFSDPAHEEANARLISAAPDMLEALQAQEAAQQALEDLADYRERAAGEGWENDPTGSLHLVEASNYAGKLQTRAAELSRAAIAKATAPAAPTP